MSALTKTSEPPRRAAHARTRASSQARDCSAVQATLLHGQRPPTPPIFSFSFVCPCGRAGQAEGRVLTYFAWALPSGACWRGGSALAYLPPALGRGGVVCGTAPVGLNGGT